MTPREQFIAKLKARGWWAMNKNDLSKNGLFVFAGKRLAHFDKLDQWVTERFENLLALPDEEFNKIFGESK